MKKYLLILLVILPDVYVEGQINNPKNLPFTWKTDTGIHNVNLSELTVLLPLGTFPAIDYPGFVGRKRGRKMFFKHEPVISVEINKEAKAYPLNMLTVHEMANDSLAGIPILPTYCPLCNAGIVFDRRLEVNNKDYLLEFEVSGMLRKSDMVMYDKQTQTLWQQLTGEGIVGELTGTRLKVIPSLIVSVEEFFERYPDGQILSKNTGMKRAEETYGYNYYENYDGSTAKPYEHFFTSEDIDPRLPPMERVVDIRSNGRYKVYPFSKIANEGVINDTFKGKHIVIFYKKGTVSVLDEKDIRQSKSVGSVTVFKAEIDGQKLTFRKKKKLFVDEQTGSAWDIAGKCIDGPMAGKQLRIEPHSNHFAFAWLAFHPQSEIYGE